MPDATKHYSQIFENTQFLNSFVEQESDIKTSFPGWAIVVIFYTAVHWVEYYFFKTRRKHCRDHRERNNELVNETPLESIYNDYERLYDWSRDARYSVVSFTEDDVEEALEHLGKVEKQILILVP